MHVPCQYRRCTIAVCLTAWLTVALSVSALSHARAQPSERAAQQRENEPPSDITEEAAGNQPANEPEDTAAVPVPIPGQVPPPPITPSPFEFTLKGTVAVTLYAQDTPFLTGNGSSALLGPLPVVRDGWSAGGDVRQTRLSFNVRGPELLGATPTASVEFEMYGGNQITTVPAPPSTVAV